MFELASGQVATAKIKWQAKPIAWNKIRYRLLATSTLTSKISNQHCKIQMLNQTLPDILKFKSGTIVRHRDVFQLTVLRLPVH